MTDTLIRIAAGESANFTYMVATATQTRCCLYTNLIPLTPKYSAVRHVLLNQRHLVTTFGLYLKSSLLGDIYDSRTRTQPIPRLLYKKSYQLAMTIIMRL